MTNSQRLAMIRRALVVWLNENRDVSPISEPTESSPSDSSDRTESSVPRSSSPRFHESVLIRDGFYCGRRFSNESIQAIWFMEEDQVKISQAQTNELLCSLDRDGISQLLEREDVPNLEPEANIVPLPQPKRHAA